MFKKGVSGNANGRPKGSISEKTKVWNEIGEWFTNDGMESYKKNLQKMLLSNDTALALEAMKRFEALIEFFKPKLSRSEIKAEVETITNIDLSKYPTENLKDALRISNEGTDSSGTL